MHAAFIGVIKFLRLDVFQSLQLPKISIQLVLRNKSITLVFFKFTLYVSF